MMKGSWSLRELITWHRWNRLPERIRHVVFSPLKWRWLEDIQAIDSLLDEIQASMEPDIYRLLMEACIATIITNKNEVSENIRHKTAEKLIQKYHPFGLSQNINFLEASWGYGTCIVVSSKEQGEPRVVLVGLHDPQLLESMPLTLPAWDKTTDESAKLAVRTLNNLALNRFGKGLIVWPILPTHERLQICGASIGLAVYAAAWSAFNKKELINVVFSGEIFESGKIKLNGFFKTKKNIARKEGFRTFICGSSPGITKLEYDEHFEVIPVSDLDELECLLENYTPGCGRSFIEQHNILKSKESLSARVHHLDRGLICSSPFRKVYNSLVDDIIDEQGLLQDFAANLKKACEKRAFAPDICKILLDPFNEQKLRKLANLAPHVATDIIMCRYACSMAEGNTEEARLWFSVAMEALNNMPKSIASIEHLADLYNRRVVQERHLRFFFSPELPAEFVDIMERIEKTRDVLGVKSYPVLGRMYGTVAQNYGFCGPQFFEKTKEYVSKAQEAFGSGKDPHWRDDWLREWNYLVYAALDAGMEEEAKVALMHYLDIPQMPSSHREKSWNRYQKAALARWVADTRSYYQIFAEVTEDEIKQLEPIHPNQLWAFNVGRIMEKPGMRRTAWIKSYQISMSLKGPAKVMGLLPLAGLYVMELADRKYLEKATLEILSLIGSESDINRDHFDTLLKFDNWRDVLTEVWNGRHRYFPFTYR